VFGLGSECVRIWGSGCVKMWEENVKRSCLDSGMLEWMCKKSLWEFVSDMMVVREFYFFFKLLNVTLQIYYCLLNFFNNKISYVCLKKIIFTYL